MDLDPNCQTKKDWYKKPSAPAAAPAGTNSVQTVKEATDMQDRRAASSIVQVQDALPAQEKALKKETNISGKPKLHDSIAKDKTKKRIARKAKKDVKNADTSKKRIKKISKK